MIIRTEPSFDLINKEQIKFLQSLKIDSRMSTIEKIEALGLKLAFTEENVGGFFSKDDKEIVVCEDYIDSEHFKTIVSHELSHYIQSQTVDLTYDSILKCIVYEQQCESISKFLLMPKLFPNEKQTYISYFSLKDWNWLIEHSKENYYDIEDDFSEVKFNYIKKYF